MRKPRLLLITLLKCELKPIDVRVYQALFSAEQSPRLKRIFPDGVCDYGKPGVGQVPLRGTYQAY